MTPAPLPTMRRTRAAAAGAMLRRRRRWLLAVLLALGGLAFGLRCVYVLDDNQLAWVHGGLRGQGKAVATGGLHLKWPWQKVHRFNQQMHWRELQPVVRTLPTGETIRLSATAVWQTAPDGLRLRVELPYDDETLAALLSAVITEGLDRTLAQCPLDALVGVADDPASYAATVCLGEAVKAERAPWILEHYGLKLLDVSVSRLVIPTSVRTHRELELAAQRKVEADQLLLKRKTEADEIMHAAAQRVAEIRTRAQQEAEQIKREANEEAATIRVQGKARATRFVAEARRPGLESLLKAVEGYRALMDKDTTLVVEGGREFFRLLESLPITARTNAAQTRPAQTAQLASD